MAKRTPPRPVAALAAVQRVRRLAAQTALADARDAEDRAREAEQAASDASRTAQEAWIECLARPRLAPEYAALLASALIDSDASRGIATADAARAAGEHQDRRDDWQAADARVTATEKLLATACRSETRHREERAAIETASRFTYDWTRR